MRSKLAQTGITVPIREYENCLVENRRTSERNTLSPITPKKPAWLNDYYVASALEALSSECKIVKATKFELKGFPPRPESYLFLNKRAGTTAKQQADAIESEGQCLVHQLFWQCLENPRYEISGSPETTAPGITRFLTQWKLIDEAPSCSKCWEVEERRNAIRLLVDGITNHDLATSATVEITGMNREFQEAVISTCIQSQCAAEVATVKKIIEQAIEIRSEQIASLPADNRREWTDQSTVDFKSSLSASISAKRL